MGAASRGKPGCPELAFSTMSIASVRIVFTQSRSSSSNVRGMEVLSVAGRVAAPRRTSDRITRSGLPRRAAVREDDATSVAPGQPQLVLGDEVEDELGRDRRRPEEP